MSFDAREISIEDGIPIFLYRFTLNDKVWRYTSADGDIVALGVTWEARPIADDGVKITGESSTDALTITASTVIMPAQIYMHYPPARPIQVAILRMHEGDTEVKTVYMGEITQVNVPTPGTARITCETLSASMQRDGLRFGWQRTCPYALYDPLTCKVPKEVFRVAATINSMSDGVLQVNAIAGYPENRFAGGFLEWTDVVRGVERRAIESSTTSGALTMFGTIDGLEPTLQIFVFPGCMRTTASCATFDNLLNYGGIPAMQGKSPFDGDPVFY